MNSLHRDRGHRHRRKDERRERKNIRLRETSEGGRKGQKRRNVKENRKI